MRAAHVRFLLHRLRSVAFVIVSTCSFNESLLCRITPKYLSEVTSSRGLKFWVEDWTFITFLASLMVLLSISMLDGGEERVD